MFSCIFSNYIGNLLKDKIKFIVFGHHQYMLNAISECLNKKNVEFIRIDGATKNEVRATYIKRFQEQESCRVAVLSLKACNAGITLTAAKLVLFAELDWNPSVSCFFKIYFLVYLKELFIFVLFFLDSSSS